MANCLPQSLAASKGGALICEGTAFGRSHNANGVYVFSGVGTSRCDVRAACSGATPSNAIVARIFVPPATARAGTAQRAIPTIAPDTYESQGNRQADKFAPLRRHPLAGSVCRRTPILLCCVLLASLSHSAALDLSKA